jgi:hypothetical protein
MITTVAARWLLTVVFAAAGLGGNGAASAPGCMLTRAPASRSP